MSDYYVSPLQEQAALVPEPIRRAIGEGLRNASTKGFKDFNQLLMIIVGHTLQGNITPDQVKAITPLLELLFASVAADTMRKDTFRMSAIRGTEDPVGTYLEQSIQRGRKLRPMVEVNDKGGAIHMTVHSAKGGHPERIKVIDSAKYPKPHPERT